MDDLRTALSSWLTMALDGNFEGISDMDLLALRDWVDGGCAGDMPQPQGVMPVGDATRLAESMRVYWETKDWSRAQFRKALVDARLM